MITQRMKKGALYQSASGEVVMYTGIIVDHDGTWYEVQKFGGAYDRVDIPYFHRWYRPARDIMAERNRREWRLA